MTRILVTNDDGVYAPGLLALKNAMTELGEVVVIAPDSNRSAIGHAKTMHKPLRVDPVKLADGSPAYACSGSPADCVALVALGALPGPFNMVASGINPNPNVGHDVTYSGTVTAAMEGLISGWLALAVSTDAHQAEGCGVDDPFRAAAAYALRLARLMLEHGLPKDVLLSLNVPGLPLEAIRGLQVTRQGLRVYRDELVKRLDPRGRPYYWIGGEEPSGVPQEGTDIGALADGYVSLTPLHLDLTAHGAIEWLSKLA
jgi:5'-nucleotidase